MRLAQLYCCVGGACSRIGAGGAANTLRPAFVCRSHIINPHILKCKVYQDIFRASVYIGRGPFFDVYFSKPQKADPRPISRPARSSRKPPAVSAWTMPAFTAWPFLRRGGSQGIIREKTKQKPCNHCDYRVFDGGEGGIRTLETL